MISKNIISFLILFCFSFSCLSVEKKVNSTYFDFLKQESNKEKKKYQYNELESVVSGFAAFVVGNIGHFTTKSYTLKLGYSGVQTIGIVNIAQGIYDFYWPSEKKELLGILQNNKSTTTLDNREYLAKNLTLLFAKKERAQRLSIFYGSTFLCLQYSINYFGTSSKSKNDQELKNIYLFLSGVNAMISAYSYFHLNEYEQFINDHNPELWEQKNITNISPALNIINQKLVPGLFVSLQF